MLFVFSDLWVEVASNLGREELNFIVAVARTNIERFWHVQGERFYLVEIIQVQFTVEGKLYHC